LQAAGAAVETAGPRFFGYVPGGGLISSAVGELMALVLNRFTGIGEMAPGLVALEHGVLDWLGSLFEMPPGATGILTTGGSQAMISMIVAAREHHLRQTDLSRARMYLSDQTHHSIAKAAHICGFPSGSIHVVPTAAGGKLDPAALASAIADDRAAGYIPFLVVGTAGTTNLGLVEPLAKLAGIARDNGLWFHVDGCYGGFFQLTRRGRARLDGIGLADSITVDPHRACSCPTARVRSWYVTAAC
jgi:aromatic-L-amino-acid decarboxylase